jgi:hypothetical protein
MFIPGKLGKQTEPAHHDLQDSNNKNPIGLCGAVAVPFRGGSYNKNRPTEVAKMTLDTESRKKKP